MGLDDYDLGPEHQGYAIAPEDDLPPAPAWYRGTRQQWQVERRTIAVASWRERIRIERIPRPKRRVTYYLCGIRHYYELEDGEEAP